MRQHESSYKILVFSSLGLLTCLAATPLSLAGGTAAAETPPLTDEERIAVETLAGLGEAVIYHKLVHGSYPEPFNQLIPLVELGETFNALVEGSTHRDPWGSPSSIGATAWTAPW